MVTEPAKLPYKKESIADFPLNSFSYYQNYLWLLQLYSVMGLKAYKWIAFNRCLKNESKCNQV